MQVIMADCSMMAMVTSDLEEISFTEFENSLGCIGKLYLRKERKEGIKEKKKGREIRKEERGRKRKKEERKEEKEKKKRKKEKKKGMKERNKGREIRNEEKRKERRKKGKEKRRGQHVEPDIGPSRSESSVFSLVYFIPQQFHTCTEPFLVFLTHDPLSAHTLSYHNSF